MNSDVRVHPFAAMFPMMSGEELQELADDIKANGLKLPVVYDRDGQLIDGRNRLAACEMAGVEATSTVLLDGADPVAHILSSNIQRRHLTKGQQAMLAVKGYAISSSISNLEMDQLDQRAVAAAVHVPLSRVSEALTVYQYAAELVDSVISGMPLSQAYKTAQERKAVALDTARVLKELEREAPDLFELVQTEQLDLPEAEMQFLTRRGREHLVSLAENSIALGKDLRDAKAEMPPEMWPGWLEMVMPQDDWPAGVWAALGCTPESLVNGLIAAADAYGAVSNIQPRMVGPILDLVFGPGEAVPTEAGAEDRRMEPETSATADRKTA